MLWPFNRPRTRPGVTIEAIYGMIVAQARLPVFYEHYRVPDTVNGRFDMVLLHLWLVLRRLRANAAGTALSQALIDRFDGVEMALAAYNAGETAVRKFNGIPPYRETRNYVSRILSIAGLK